MRIAFIGFGEAARAFVASLRSTPDLTFAAYDVLLGSGRDSEGALRDAAGEMGVALADSPAAAIESAEWIISAVTATDSLEAGRSVASFLTTGQTFIDINSVSAGRKRETAQSVCAGGAAYVDMAVMAPVHPRGHRAPVLLAGPDCETLEARFSRLGFAYSIVGDEIGAATSIKMLRSLFVKGMEAVTVQTLLAAKAAGRFDEVYASLSESFPQLDWPKYPKYQIERVSRHGVRRAAEMRESAATQKELGFDAGHKLADAIADVQEQIGRLGFVPDTDADVADQYSSLLGAFRNKA
ncbi:DUF1932 domain-containing protein [Mesorhizobium sp. CAU 1741]|uniref:NAD(P)-dependent oxidoreductase n=1 Tax=Mesorhizobium sp. CAU 1741 TaxID=3140366 RepID=UPI00325B02FF